jgi:class 3 adenylate cyclase
MRALADVAFPTGPVEQHRRCAQVWRQSLSAPVAARYLELQLTADVRAAMPRVAAPTLVIQRRDARLIPIRAAREAAALIPDASFVAVDGDSAVLWYHHEQTARAIERFLGYPAAPDLAPVRPALRTVLFTDVVGHTAMMQRLGDARGREVLRDHERLTRELLRRHGGAEVKTMGDGFMASFASVSGALECAVALQRAFARRNESAAEPLHVRVGLNAGEPIEEEGDLFGATVVLASRIAAQAEGGEILVPEPVRHLLAGKDFAFTDRGAATLKGFVEPVRLYAVRW